MHKYLTCFFLQSQAHDGVECPEFVGWAMAHKSKASEATYDPNDPPSSYSNPSVYSRINAYTEVGKQLYGPEWDPSAHPLDAEVIMRAGGGRKHGRFIIGDGAVDSSSCPTLSQIRARDPGTGPAIRQRQTVAQLHVQQLEVNSASFIHYSITNHIFAMHCNIGMKNVGPASGGEKAPAGGRGEAADGYGEAAGGYGELVCLHSNLACTDGRIPTTASDSVTSESTNSSGDLLPNRVDSFLVLST